MADPRSAKIEGIVTQFTGHDFDDPVQRWSSPNEFQLRYGPVRPAPAEELPNALHKAIRTDEQSLHSVRPGGRRWIVHAGSNETPICSPRARRVARELAEDSFIHDPWQGLRRLVIPRVATPRVRLRLRDEPRHERVEMNVLTERREIAAGLDQMRLESALE